MQLSDWSSYVCPSVPVVATRKLGIELAQDRQNLRLADLVEEDICARPPVFGGIDFEQRAKLGLEAVSAIAAGEARLQALTDGKRKPCCLVRFVQFAEQIGRADVCNPVNQSNLVC